MTHAFLNPVSRAAMAIALCATALAGCNKAADTNQQQAAPATGAPIAALPLATATPPPVALAPAVAALPAPARPVRYAAAAGSGRYRYVDQAYAMNDAFGETPPDYTVDYDGTRPWIWRAGNGAYRVVEQVPGGERYYYYRSGADEPYYVADPDYGYAYDDGALVGVYGPNGYPVDDAVARDRAYDAARYYARANGLYRAAQTQQRQAAYAQNWDARRDAVLERQQQWQQAQQQDADWRAWHADHVAQEQNTWHDESRHRLAYAAAIGLGGAAIAAVALHGHHDDLGRHQAQPQADQAHQGQVAAEQQRQSEEPAAFGTGAGGPAEQSGAGRTASATGGATPAGRTRAGRAAPATGGAAPAGGTRAGRAAPATGGAAPAGRTRAGRAAPAAGGATSAGRTRAGRAAPATGDAAPAGRTRAGRATAGPSRRPGARGASTGRRTARGADRGSRTSAAAACCRAGRSAQARAPAQEHRDREAPAPGNHGQHGEHRDHPG